MIKETFWVEQVHEGHCEELVALAHQWGDNLLRRDDREACVDACKDHNGLIMRSPDGSVIGSCFVRRRELSFERSTRRRPDMQCVTYLHRYLIAGPYRNRGLGRDLLRSTISFEYGRSDDYLPDFVGVCFADAHAASRAFDAVGVLRFEEGSFAGQIHKTMFAVKTMIQESRRNTSFDGDTEILILDMERMPEIATWAISAFGPNGAHDDKHGTIVRIRDVSEGRSGIVDELGCLANRHPHALARIGLDTWRKLAG